MADKTIKARLINKHDSEAKWIEATGFIPKKAELIVYDVDEAHSYERFKIGDGKTTVSELPFFGRVDTMLKTENAGRILSVGDDGEAGSIEIGNGLFLDNNVLSTADDFKVDEDGNATIYASVDGAGDYENLTSELITNALGYTPASAIDHSEFNIPQLALTGDITGMDKDNKVTLNYTYDGKSGTLTCKWQGSSSLNYPKKNYTIEFDNAFEAKTGWGTQKKYCLKAHWVDASYMRNQLSAVLWGQMVKCRSFAPAALTSLPNGGAIDGFPVWVTINGEPMGLYMFNIPKEPWLFGMTGANVNEAILCSENFAFFNPAVCDGTDIKIEYTANPDPSPIIASFNAMVTALNNVASADDLAALEAVLDIETAVDYYVLVSTLCHDDGIGRNTLFTTFDGTKWYISAYDMDACFGNAPDGSGYGWANDYPLLSNLDADQKLFQVLKTYYSAWIKSRFQGLRGWVLGNINVQAEAYKIAAQIPKVLLDEDLRLWPNRPGTLTSDVHQILEYYRERMGTLDYEATQMS